MSYLDDFRKILSIKRYSYRTIKSYTNALKVFLDASAGTISDNITLSDIENYKNCCCVW